MKEQYKRLGSEIVKKDGDIAQNEKKILYLKKKTQELEKFKFVLDFKIKELRRDIAPRETEIHNLRTKTKEMDKELKKYNTINASLGFMVDDLRTRQETMQEVIKQNRNIIRNNNMQINGFKNAVHAVVPHIDTQESLQKAVWTHLGKYIQDQQAKEKNDDPEIKKEYDNQKRYLENSLHSLKKRLESESQIHKEENLNIMNANIKLIENIFGLRRNVQQLARQLQRKKPRRTDDEELEDQSKANEEGSQMIKELKSKDDQQEQLYSLHRTLDYKNQYVARLR